MALPYEDADDRRAYLESFGEPLVYFDGETLTDLWGIVTDPYQRVDGPNRPPVATSSPEIEIALDDVAEPRQGDLIFRGERAEFEGVFTFQVASPRPDAGRGLAKLIVKAAPQ